MIHASLERDVLVVVCAVSAGIHAGLAPGHFHEATSAGVGFLSAALLLAALCLALTVRPGSRLAASAAGAVLAGLVAVYGLAVTRGVPVLHPEPEPAGWVGLVTKAFELVGLAVALHLSAPDRTAGRLIRLQPKGTTR